MEEKREKPSHSNSAQSSQLPTLCRRSSPEMRMAPEEAVLPRLERLSFPTSCQVLALSLALSQSHQGDGEDSIHGLSGSWSLRSAPR